MNTKLSRTASLFLTPILLLSCASADDKQKSITISQQTAGQSERFSQYELDVAYRKQAREDTRAYNSKGILNVCCVVFYHDIKMLEKVSAHFHENVEDDINLYGIVVQENEDHYVVQFWERYRTSTQYEIDGFWHAGVSDSEVPQYAYLVDRKTLEILEFKNVPL